MIQQWSLSWRMDWWIAKIREYYWVTVSVKILFMIFVLFLTIFYRSWWWRKVYCKHFGYKNCAMQYIETQTSTHYFASMSQRTKIEVVEDKNRWPCRWWRWEFGFLCAWNGKGFTYVRWTSKTTNWSTSREHTACICYIARWLLKLTAATSSKKFLNLPYWFQCRRRHQYNVVVPQIKRLEKLSHVLYVIPHILYYSMMNFYLKQFWLSSRPKNIMLSQPLLFEFQAK